MATITITADEWPAVLKKRIEEDTELLKAAALEACARGEREAVKITNKKDLVDIGHYKGAWQHRAISNGAEVFNDSPHAAPLEYGRRPNRPGPPYAPIREWVERKLVGKGLVSPEDADGVAWVIRNNIHTRGTPPHRVMWATFQKMKRFLSQAARERLG